LLSHSKPEDVSWGALVAFWHDSLVSTGLKIRWDDWSIPDHSAPAPAGRPLSGFTKLGVENAPAFITRGVLIDIAGYKGVDMLGDSYEITVDDVQGALKKQSLTLKASHAVIIHTGWGKLYGKDNALYVKSCPGIGIKAAEWLIAQDPVLLGYDNWPVEVAPNPVQ
jgi:hypothetical protein